MPPAASISSIPGMIRSGRRVSRKMSRQAIRLYILSRPHGGERGEKAADRGDQLLSRPHGGVSMIIDLDGKLAFFGQDRRCARGQHHRQS